MGGRRAQLAHDDPHGADGSSGREQGQRSQDGGRICGFIESQNSDGKAPTAGCSGYPARLSGHRRPRADLWGLGGLKELERQGEAPGADHSGPPTPTATGRGVVVHCRARANSALLGLVISRRIRCRRSLTRSTVCWQVWQRPVQHLNSGWSSWTAWGSVRPAAGDLGAAAPGSGTRGRRSPARCGDTTRARSGPRSGPGRARP